MDRSSPGSAATAPAESRSCCVSHLDVVPAPADRWAHDPFSADIADGYIWGRGAVDMKSMVALQLGVFAASPTRRGPPAGSRDRPDPGAPADILFACTADEEAGGKDGAAWLVEHRPEGLRAGGAQRMRRCSVAAAGRRFYPIQVGEKGYAPTGSRSAGHGVMARCRARTTPRCAPRGRRAAGRARTIRDDAADARASRGGRDGPRAAGADLRRIAGDDAGRSEAALRSLCDPSNARATRALLRDTLSPDVVNAGVKYNVIPGEATVIVDCRVLPGTTEPEMRAEVERRLGDLATCARSS